MKLFQISPNDNTAHVLRGRHSKYFVTFTKFHTTIYASDKFTTESCSETDERLFYQCFKLVGGSGSMVDSDNTKIGRVYARIDGGEDAPGYFTLKQ